MFPYSTDAPLYHFPKATLGLIGINVSLYVAICFAMESVTLFHYRLSEFPWIEQLCLQSDTVQPTQWVTSFFMHASCMHLVSNMLCLWAFGLIVEGKIGWWKFLSIYLGIGILNSAIWQLVLFPLAGAHNVTALGASGAVFGLMAIALMWAPENELELVWFFFIVPLRNTWTVSTFVIVSAAIEILVLALSEFALSGAFAHAIGFLSGVGVGVFMLKQRLVDCEGYDLITCWQGREGEKTLTREQEREQREQQAAVEAWQEAELQKGYASIEFLLEKGSADAVIGRFRALKKMVPHALWQQTHLYQLIRIMLSERRFVDVVPWIKEYLRHFEKHSELMKLTLAEIYLSHADRPRQALQVASQIDRSRITREQAAMSGRIVRDAKSRLAQGSLDFEGD